MKLKDIPYRNHRQVWKSHNFLKEFFRIEHDKDVKDNASVKNFLYQLSRIPEQREFTLAGYGSLLNEKDVPRTLPDYKFHREGVIKGYNRVFNVGWDKAWLNVEKSEDEDDELIVALIDFPYYELPTLISREFNYSFYEVITDESNNGKEDALIVIGRDDCIDNTLEPIMNYLHLCLSGIKDMSGLDGINNFLDLTYCYSPVKHNRVTIREYLNDFDLTNYMIKNEYISR